MGNRLQHDASWAIAASILECVENCILPEDRKDAFDAFYERVRAGIECYEQMVQREAARLCKPSLN